MALDIGLTSVAVQQLVANLCSTFRSMHVQLTGWRNRLVAGAPVTASEVFAMTSLVSAARAAGEAQAATPGLGDAWVREFPNYNPNSLGPDWTAIKAAMDAYFTFVINAWPEKSASGKLAFYTFDASTRTFMDYSISIDSNGRTALINAIDNLRATFKA